MTVSGPRGNARAPPHAQPTFRFLLQHDSAERYPEGADRTFVARDYNLHQHNVYMLWQLGAP